MKYSVIHSKDPYLLARMATDLQMSFSRFKPVHDTPFDTADKEWLCIYDDYTFGFYIHDCYSDPIVRYELTESNYLQVLEAVLS